MAVREGFEPSIRCRIHTFQACSFSHSDTSPFFDLLFRREIITFISPVCLWLRRTPCVLSFIASFAGLGQPLGHLTVFDSLFKAWNLTFFQFSALWLRRTPCVLSFIASFAGLGQPLGHLTVFDSLLKAWNLTSLQSACYEHMAG